VGPFYKRSGFVFLLLSLLVSAVFIGGSNWFTDGHPTFPTDDSYIYFQYARQLVSGHPFQYNTGDAPTTGMTSFLYWITLSFGYLIGFRGPLLFLLAFLIGVAGLLISAWLMYRIVEALVGAGAGLPAAVLFLVNGQIVWGYLSGLEIPLFTTLLLFSVLSFLRDMEGKTYKRTMVVCALLTISRPEGVVLGCSLALLLLLAGHLRGLKEGLKGLQKGWAWVLLPFSISIAYLVMNKAVGGHFSPSSGSSKSLWIDPHIFSLIYAGTSYVLDTIRGIFGAGYPSIATIGFAGHSPISYFAPFALFFFLFGSFAGAARELRSRQISGFTVLLAVFTIGVGFVAFTSASGFQHHRYLIPFYPIFILCMVAGVFVLSSALGEKLGERSFRDGLLAFFVVLSVVGLVYSFVQYAFESRLVRVATVEPAEWVRSKLKKGDVLGLVDAGALKYYGGKKTVDLLGLTTARFYGRWRMGWGAVAEEVSHMTKGERPSHIAIVSTFAEKSEGIESLYELFGDKVYEPVPIYGMGQTIFAVDYSSVDAGRLPVSDHEGWIAVDSLDIGYLEDEQRCRYSILSRESGARLDVGLHSATYGDEKKIADGGRLILGGERFTISTLPGKTLRIVTRSVSGFKTFRYSPVLPDGYITSNAPPFTPVDVYVSGLKLEGAGIKTLGNDTWCETVLEVPSQFVFSEKTTIEIIGSYNSFHYWFFQK